MNKSFFNKYYSSRKYYGKYQPIIDISIKPDLSNRSRSALIYNHIKNQVKKTSKILDIGSGPGNTLLYLKSKGYKKLYATEINIQGVKRLKAFNIKCFHGDLNKFCKNTKIKYDLIILSHVLEHLVEPNKALKRIRNILSQKGLIYIRVPNFYSHGNPYTKFTLPHTFYFSKNTLNNLLHTEGFQIIKNYNQDSDELVVICKPAKFNKMFPFNNEYSKTVKFLKKFAKLPITKKQLFIKTIINFMPNRLYDFIVDHF